MTPGLTFDAATHVYAIDGRVLPSVTGILRDVFGDPTAGRSEQWHMDRGSAAHALYALMALGVDLAGYIYDDRLQGHVDAWRAWRRDEQPEFVAIEIPVQWCRVYAGTPDAIVRMRGRTWIIDYKQSASRRDRLQMAAYALACGCAIPIDGIISLQIDGERWKYGELIKARELSSVVADWRCVLRTWQLKQEIK